MNRREGVRVGWVGEKGRDLSRIMGPGCTYAIPVKDIDYIVSTSFEYIYYTIHETLCMYDAQSLREGAHWLLCGWACCLKSNLKYFRYRSKNPKNTTLPSVRSSIPQKSQKNKEKQERT